LGHAYNFCIQNHYYPTQAATGAFFSMLGDAIAQTTEKGALVTAKRESDMTNDSDGNVVYVGQQQTTDTLYSYDPRRGLAYLFKGLGGGIIWACWFDIADLWSKDLDNLIFSNEGIWYAPGVDWSASLYLHQVVQTVISILLEQFLVCPILYSCWDIPVTALLRGSPARQIPLQINEKLRPLLIANAKVWTPVNCITYNIPLEFRVLFTSAADIVWQTINASITSRDIQILPSPTSASSAAATSTANDNAPFVVTTAERRRRRRQQQVTAGSTTTG
jgi:protein Mpv17